ncbi:MAG: amidohydrolase family protein [Gemmataceae bacterium]
MRVREERERLRQLDVGCAASLHKAGVKFAFTTQGLAVARFRENVRKAIAAGLPADAALAALTRDAAEILGVTPQVGRITKGRAAHLVVCDGDFNATATKYKFAFADGVRFDLDEKAAALPGPANPLPQRRGREPRWIRACRCRCRTRWQQRRKLTRARATTSRRLRSTATASGRSFPCSTARNESSRRSRLTASRDCRPAETY